jgi:hypothetical protein
VKILSGELIRWITAMIDRFAVYLRPETAALQCDPAALAAATANQKKWGGLHVTLCSFAPKNGDDDTGSAHGSSLRRALAAAAEAMRDVASETRWRLGDSADERLALYEYGPSGELASRGVGLPTATRTLHALCGALSELGLQNVRRPDQLHMTLGRLEVGAAEAVRCALQRCPGWELVIAKCAAHEPELRTTQFNEVMPLSWPSG